MVILFLNNLLGFMKIVLPLGKDPPAITSLSFNHNGKILAAAATDGMCSRQEFPSGMFPGRRAHSSPGGWRRLRAAVGLLLHYRALSGKSRRARLFGQG
ncbi:hypothetical protein PS2_001137 [Malus domestica]